MLYHSDVCRSPDILISGQLENMGDQHGKLFSLCSEACQRHRVKSMQTRSLSLPHHVYHVSALVALTHSAMCSLLLASSELLE